MADAKNQQAAFVSTVIDTVGLVTGQRPGVSRGLIASLSEATGGKCCTYSCR